MRLVDRWSTSERRSIYLTLMVEEVLILRSLAPACALLARCRPDLQLFFSLLHLLLLPASVSVLGGCTEPANICFASELKREGAQRHDRRV